MNNQELIKKFEERKTIIGNFQGYAVWWEDIKEIFEELDEPQKPVVPQFVADWYEENKDDFETSLFQCVYEIFKKRNDNELSKFENWLVDADTEPFKTLVNMHQFGYEVEEEKRCRIKFIQTGQHLAKNIFASGEYFVIKNSAISSIDSFTRKELEDADFGWIFSCEGIEIEEVE